MTNQVPLSTLPREGLAQICSYRRNPSEILIMRRVSWLFHDVIAVEAARAFFINHRRSIYMLGFLPTSSDHYENFKNLFLFIREMCRTIYFKEPIIPEGFANPDAVNVLSLSRIDQTFALRFKINCLARLRLGRMHFPCLAQQNRVASVMAYPRKNESEVKTNDRLWQWLRKEPYEIPQMKEITVVNPPDEALQVFSIPYEITYFRDLRKLELSGHQLTHVPTFLSKLQQLEVLSLQNNHIQTVHCRFNQMLRLKSIDLTHNPLPQLPPSDFFSQRRLVHLSVDAKTAIHAPEEPDRYPVFIIFNAQNLDPACYDPAAQVIYQNFLLLKKSVKNDAARSKDLQELEPKFIEARDGKAPKSMRDLLNLQFNLLLKTPP